MKHAHLSILFVTFISFNLRRVVIYLVISEKYLIVQSGINQPMNECEGLLDLLMFNEHSTSRKHYY